MTFAPVDDVRLRLGEGPCWDETRQALWCVDIDAGRLHRLDGTTWRTWDPGRPVAAVAVCRSGALCLAATDGFYLWAEPGTGSPALLATIDRGPTEVRLNDGACDPHGRFWAGTLTADRTPRGRLWRLDPDHTVAVVADGITVSNGLGFAADPSRCYYIDTPTCRIDTLQVHPESGAVLDRRLFCDLSAVPGKPDGLAIDAAGDLWVAMWGGACLARVTPAGQVAEVYPVPVGCPTRPAFGGPALRDLYVTSAQRPKLAEGPLDGAVLRAEVTVPGRPAWRFHDDREAHA